MRHVMFERPPLNLPALEDDLRAALGAAYAGCSLTPAALVVHLNGDSDAEGERRARFSASSSPPACRCTISSVGVRLHPA